jgi:hypothetical protein
MRLFQVPFSEGRGKHAAPDLVEFLTSHTARHAQHLAGCSDCCRQCVTFPDHLMDSAGGVNSVQTHTAVAF